MRSSKSSFSSLFCSFKSLRTTPVYPWSQGLLWRCLHTASRYHYPGLLIGNYLYNSDICSISVQTVSVWEGMSMAIILLCTFVLGGGGTCKDISFCKYSGSDTREIWECQNYSGGGSSRMLTLMTKSFLMYCYVRSSVICDGSWT